MERQYGTGIPRKIRGLSPGHLFPARILPVLYLLLTLGAVVYYILGAGAAEFHSDCTDSLLWAKTSIDAGRTLDPDFHYAGYIPFGSSLWSIPLIRIFGYTMLSYRLSMLIFFALFVAAAGLFFRMLDLSRGRTAYAVGTLLMLCSATEKMREIFWGHVIYYSLSVLFLSLAFSLIRRRNIPLLALLSIGVAVNGLQGISTFHLPLAAAILSLKLFEHRRLRLRELIAVGLGLPFGYGIKLFLERGGVTAPYASAYMRYSDEEQWLSHALQLPKQLRSLFGAGVPENTPMASVDSLIFLLRLLLVLALVVLPVYLFVRRRREKVELELYSCLYLAALILFTMIYGRLGSASWRLIPAIIAPSLLSLAYLYRRTVKVVPLKRLLALLFVAFTLLQAGTLYAMPFDGWRRNHLASLRDALDEADAGDTPVYGNFWQAHALRLISEEAIDSRTVHLRNQHIVPYDYQVTKRGYLETAAKEGFFLILTKKEYIEAAEDLAKIRPYILRERKLPGKILLEGRGNLWAHLELEVEKYFPRP